MLNYKLYNLSKTDSISTLENDDLQTFYDRTNLHKKYVNEYANKLGFSFPKHDKTKFSDICQKDSYAKMQLDIDNKNLTKSAFFLHKRINPHHPEFWFKVKYMPKLKVAEMCCDWQALHTELGGKDKFSSALDYFVNYTQNKYDWTEKQKKLITSFCLKITR